MAELTARNKLPGIVKSIRADTIMSEVVVTIEGTDYEVVSVTTNESLKSLSLEVGSKVYIVVKSTNVMLGGRNGEQEKAEGKLAAPQPVRVPSPQIQREDSRPCLFN